jgi:putative membrane protein
MHPLTPVLKAWTVVAAVFVLAVWEAGPQLSGEGGIGAGAALLGLATLLVTGVLVGGAYAAIAWRVTRYALDEERVYLQTGVLFRRHREARLDRLQAVDVVQPLVARVFGLAQLTIEQAGGSGSQVALAYLSESRAQEVRNEILARAAGLALDVEPRATGVEPGAPDVERRASPAPAPEAPEREVLAVPPRRLVGSILLSPDVVAVVLLVTAILVIAVLTASPGPLGALLPVVLGGTWSAWSRFTRDFSFRAAISPDGIRLRHGLTESRAQTVPPGRVQAVRLVQPMLWRLPDWWQVRMNVAGYAGSEGGKESVLLPVGTREEALLAAWLVLPDLGVPDARAVLDAGLTGRDAEGEFIPSPSRARWLDPVGRRRNGLRVTPAALLLRRGRVTRQLDLVPHERTQSLGLAQGPFQRFLRLSSFVAHSTPGPVSPVAQHLDAEVAARTLMLQAERARSARASAGPERWMSQGP